MMELISKPSWLEAQMASKQREKYVEVLKMGCTRIDGVGCLAMLPKLLDIWRMMR